MGELRLQIDDGLHKQLKQRALDEEVTLKDLTKKALVEYLKRRSKQKEEANSASNQ